MLSYEKNCFLDGKEGIYRQCPFLVRTIKVPDSMGGGTKQQFQTCIGKKCAAYDDGACLRLKER